MTDAQIREQLVTMHHDAGEPPPGSPRPPLSATVVLASGTAFNINAGDGLDEFLGLWGDYRERSRSAPPWVEWARVGDDEFRLDQVILIHHG